MERAKLFSPFRERGAARRMVGRRGEQEEPKDGAKKEKCSRILGGPGFVRAVSTGRFGDMPKTPRPRGRDKARPSRAHDLIAQERLLLPLHPEMPFRRFVRKRFSNLPKSPLTSLSPLLYAHHRCRR